MCLFIIVTLVLVAVDFEIDGPVIVEFLSDCADVCVFQSLRIRHIWRYVEFLSDCADVCVFQS
jgi:hypothetical protein